MEPLKANHVRRENEKSRRFCPVGSRTKKYVLFILKKEKQRGKIRDSEFGRRYKKVCDCVVEPGNITGRTAQENGPEIIVATMDTPWFSEIMPVAVLPALEK